MLMSAERNGVSPDGAIVERKCDAMAIALGLCATPHLGIVDDVVWKLDRGTHVGKRSAKGRLTAPAAQVA